MRSLFATVLLARASADETSLMQDMVRRSAGKISAEARQSSAHLLETATKMIKNGVTPTVITFVDGSLENIEEVVMPAIVDAHADDQAYIDDLQRRFDEAVTTLGNHNDGLEAINQQREEASAAHHQCRALEAHACAKTRRCEEQLRVKWLWVKEKESEMREIHEEIHEEWCVHPPHNPSIEFCGNQPPYPNQLPHSPHALSHCFNWEQQSEYPTLTLPEEVHDFRHLAVRHFTTYVERKTAVELAWAQYNEKLGECADLSDAYDNVEHDGSTCDALQETMHRHACDYAERNREHRDWFGGHLDTLLTSYHAARADKDVLQMDRIAEWETLTIVHCLLTHIHSTVEASLEDPSVPCPTETTDPDGVALTIEQCHSTVTRGCPYAWTQPFDRVGDTDRGTGAGNVGLTFDEAMLQAPDANGAIGTWPINPDSTTAHLCLNWFVPPCHKLEGSPSLPVFDPEDSRCHPGDLKPAPCTLEYIEKEQGSFLEHIASQYTATLQGDTEYPDDMLPLHLTGLSARGWAGCAPPLVCEQCSGLAAPPVNHQAVSEAQECKLHEEYLAPGQSNLDTFRCLDGSCLGVSGRCNGHAQCEDGSDEQGCDAPYGIPLNLAVAAACPANFNPDVHFQCSSGQCIEKAGLCNGHDNCGDGSDEAACTGAISVEVETTSGRAATVEHLQSHTAAFHDRTYSFDSLGSFAGKTFIKYHNDDKLTDLHHVMAKIRTSEPLTVYIAKAEGHSLEWLTDGGFSRSTHEGLTISGQRTINRGNVATEWQDTRHKEWDPSINTDDAIDFTEVWSKTFEAGTISIPGNNGGDGSFLIFLDRPSVIDLWGRHMEELGELKCNDNVDLVYVASQAECQEVAIAAGHPFYSYRHNGEGDGRHKCMSSAHCDSPLDDRGNDWAVYVSPDHNTEPVYDCALSAYWEYGNCGCGGNDQNQNWCGGIGSGNCPDTVQTSICPSGTAYLAEWHPKPYGGSGHAGRGTAGHLVRDGCEYIWHAQYACQAEPSPPVAPAGYEHVEAACVHGNNIRLVRDSTPAQCAELCDAEARCVAFEFGVDYGASGRYSANDCQLQSSSHHSDCNGREYNLDLYVKLQAEPECQVLHNQDIVAGTFAHYGADRMGAASSDAECSALCTASPECTAWVRQPSSGNCWLTRQSVPVFEADTDRNTGLRCD